MTTWEEILEGIVTAKKRGHPYRIPIEELALAVPPQLQNRGIGDQIDALNHALKNHGLEAEFHKAGRFVTVTAKQEQNL